MELVTKTTLWLESIKSKLKSKALLDYDREKLQERLAKLAGGVAVHVGAASEVEMRRMESTMLYTLLVQLLRKALSLVVVSL